MPLSVIPVIFAYYGAAEAVLVFVVLVASVSDELRDVTKVRNAVETLSSCLMLESSPASL